jgi:hypothetical protein
MFNAREIHGHKRSFRYVLSITVLSMLGMGSLDGIVAKNEKLHPHNIDEDMDDLITTDKFLYH